jgi:DNA-binding transcriptional ArsR family regulator
MPTQYDLELYRLKAELCKTFADPTRLMIINELRTGEKVVSYLHETLGISQPLVSRHLALLRERGIVTTRRQGSSIFYSLSDPKIIDACNIVHTVLLNQIAKDKASAERLMTLPK